MNKTLLEEAYDPESFRKIGHTLVDTLADYLTDMKGEPSQPVTQWQSPEQSLHFWQNEQKYEGNKNIQPFFEQVLARSIHIHHKHYMGHQVVPPAPLAALSGLLTGFLNNGMAVYEMGSVSTALEKIVIDMLNHTIGFSKEAGGLLTSGGTMANLTALLAARSAKAPHDVWENGNKAQLAIIVSEEAHYCVERAVRIMGWGAAGIIKIPVTDQFRMRTDLLNNYLKDATREGKKVIAVVGSACSTSTGTYDDLTQIAAFCQQHNLWFHVDGAHGGAAAFSQKYKHLVAGLSEADSVVIDFHKMLLTPALVTGLLFRNENHSYGTFAQKAQYLWESTEDKEWFNLAKRTLECTKLMMSVKVYSLLKAYGPQLFDDYVTRQYDLAATFASLIRERKSFELALAPSSNIVCFRYTIPGLTGNELNKLNARIRKSILEKGDFYIVQTQLSETVFLRVTLMNPFTTAHELNALLDHVEEIAATA